MEEMHRLVRGTKQPASEDEVTVPTAALSMGQNEIETNQPPQTSKATDVDQDIQLSSNWCCDFLLVKGEE
jgi:hypothetical protein